MKPRRGGSRDQRMKKRGIVIASMSSGRGRGSWKRRRGSSRERRNG